MKKILAALIAVMMVLSMAVACSSPEEAAAPAQEAAPAAEAQQEAAAPAADDEDDENDEDAVKNINIEFFTTFSFDTEVQKSIEDALNAIAEPEIGVHANIHFNTPATVSTVCSSVPSSSKKVTQYFPRCRQGDETFFLTSGKMGVESPAKYFEGGESL